MTVKYKINDAKSSYSSHSIEFSPKNNYIHLDQGSYNTDKLIEVLIGIRRIQNTSESYTLHEMETTINPALTSPDSQENDDSDADE